MSGIASVLQNFRKQQIQVSQIKDDAAKDREARLARQRELKARKRESEARSRAQQADSTSSLPSTSTAHASLSVAREFAALPPPSQAPLGLRQKAVVDWLQQEAAPRTVSQLNAALGCRLDADPALMRELQRNEKVEFGEDGRLAYRPEIDVKSKPALLAKIQSAKRPLLCRAAVEAYPRAERDLQALKDEGLVLGFHSFEPEVGCEVLFPVDQRLAGFVVDPALADLWERMDVPEAEDELVAAVSAAGLRPTPRRAPLRREKAERKKKPRKQSKLRAVTNTHLMHLLEGDAPTTIE